jgi:hypothetical protein
MLTKHTVQWFDTADEDKTPRITVYVTADHHDYRQKAADRNEQIAYNRPEYDDACAMGRAVVFKHDEEADNGQA